MHYLHTLLHVVIMDSDACQGGYNRVIHSKGQDVIRTVITCCDEEDRNKCSLLPVQRAPAIQIIYNSPVLYSPTAKCEASERWMRAPWRQN